MKQFAITALIALLTGCSQDALAPIKGDPGAYLEEDVWTAGDTDTAGPGDSFVAGDSIVAGDENPPGDPGVPGPELCDGIDNDFDPTTPDGADAVWTPEISTCPTSWDRRPVVELEALPDGHSYELWVAGDAAPYAVITTPGQNYHRPASPLAQGGPPPGVATELRVVACIEAGVHRCCGAPAAVVVNLVEACNTPQAASPDTVIVSEYVTDGDGPCPGADCEGGEAFEVTNLSHCPVSLDGFHLSYCNPGNCQTFRWMNFDDSAVVPPRGVYVAVRNFEASVCEYPFFGPNDPGLHGLNVSVLEMETNSPLSGGWFNNYGGGQIRVASGVFTDMETGETLALVNPYLGDATECQSVGFNAWDECGNVASTSLPDTILTPNQLGRLWHPCDAVTDPQPVACE